MRPCRRHKNVQPDPQISFELPPPEGAPGGNQAKAKNMEYNNKENPHYHKVWYTAGYGPIHYHQYACELYDAWENQKKFGKVAP